MTDENSLLIAAEDIGTLQRELGTQDAQISQLEAARNAAALGSDLNSAEEANYRLIQARRYREELAADLVSLRNLPATTEIPKELPMGLPRAKRGPPGARSGLAVVIGHSPQGDMGAVGLSPPLPTSPASAKAEYPWNKELAEWIKEELTQRNIRCEIFHRVNQGSVGILDAYRRVMAWGPQAVVELHFNCSDGSARGSETIYELAASKTWAEALQRSLVKLYSHTGKRDPRGYKLDRGLKLASETGRGKLSVTQLAPSALIEPFFGDNPTDALAGVTNKRGLATAIADAFTSFVGAGAVADPVAPPANPVAQSETGGVPPVTLWDGLHAAYSTMTVEFPQLKGISFAQWGLESGYGTSLLAKSHLNFGGLKWRDFLDDIAVPIDYTDSAGRRDKYCKFLTFENFVQGYWRRFDKISSYQGWRQHTASPEDYFNFIANIYAPPSQNPSYKPKVLDIYERLKRGNKLPTAAVERPPADGPTQPAAGDTAVSTDLVASVRTATPPNAILFSALVDHYAGIDLPFPALKPVTIAQWALESNWGRSTLAQSHYNFAGIEWSDEMSGFAAPVAYVRSDGSNGSYCRFLRPQEFVNGYWGRLDKDSRFEGWRNHVTSPSDFITFISQQWRPGDPQYARTVLGILARFGQVTPAATLPDPPGAVPGPASPEPSDMPMDGFVLHVNRIRTELRRGAGYARTVGLYQAYFQRQPIDGLNGVCFERQGPGDNSPNGRVHQRRIAAGTYPLYTQDGSKYKTIAYSGGSAYPKPGVLLGNTGSRTAILFHPGSTYLSSIGCLNFSQPLDGPADNIIFTDSRNRVIDMIDAIKVTLGDRFPSRNGRRIEGAWMIIEGEPETVRTRTRSSPDEPQSDAEKLSSEGLYELLAATMALETLPERASADLFERIAQVRDDLKDVVNEDRQNLWLAWCSSWQASFEFSDPEERAHVQTQLAEIAKRLDAARVDVNDARGLRTPLTAAAIGNQWESAAILHNRGADLNLHDRRGDTPLTAAAFNGSLETCEFLAGAGADLALVTAFPASGEATGEDAVQWEDVESCAPGSSPLACARQGKTLLPDDDPRRATYERIEALLL